MEGMALMPSTTDDARMAAMPASASLPRRSFTREDYHAMGRAGISRMTASKPPRSQPPTGIASRAATASASLCRRPHFPNLTLQTDRIVPPRPPAG